jgi:hypothetical protein
MNVVPVGKLKNTQTGPIFLIGNGESVAEYALERIPYVRRMGINRAWKLVDCKYHVLMYDTAFLQDATLYQPEWIFCPCDAAEIPGDTRAALKNNVVCIERKFGLESLDLVKGWKPSHAGLLAIQVAWYMGFNPINLIGFDGYGKHFEDYYINPLADHERHKKELQEFKVKLEKEDPNVVVVNTNKHNHYEVFNYMSYRTCLSTAWSNGYGC